MVTLGTGAAVAAGAVLLLLIVGGAALLFQGLRLRGQAAAAVADNVRLEAMLRAAPAIPMIVRADGRVQMPARMADWFGLAAAPRFLAEFSADGRGLTPEDAAALAADITAAQRAGRGFVRAVRPQGSTRAITLRGARAPGVGGTGSVVVWGFDATDSESEIARLGGEAARLSTAYDALTGLIEAAPLPMWYRSP